MAEHARRSAELAGRMRELERLAHEQRSQLRGGVVRPGERETLVALARSLSDSAVHIPEAGAKLSLAPAERDEFAFLAEVLARRSLAVANEAPYGSLESLYRRTEEIEQTCRHCHGRFRIPLGDALEGEGSLTSGGTRD